MLIIGSAAGIAFMGMEEVTFGWSDLRPRIPLPMLLAKPLCCELNLYGGGDVWEWWSSPAFLSLCCAS
jgi:hypothetical protein